jgi:hypothetical protein
MEVFGQTALSVHTFFKTILHQKITFECCRSLPCDFSLWGIVIDHVDAQNRRDANHMKFLIEQEFASLKGSIELSQAICRSNTFVIVLFIAQKSKQIC